MGRMVIKKSFTNPKSIYAILLLSVFTFLFLGAEYLYVNMISLTAGEEKTVITQNYALGISAVGFLLYPLFHRLLKRRVQIVGLFILALAASVCNFLVQKHVSYSSTLLSGMALFLFLGILEARPTTCFSNWRGIAPIWRVWLVSPMPLGSSCSF